MTAGPTSRPSGSLLADRRYAWAEGALSSGDAVGAADLAEQVIALAPDFAPAWLLLGEARAALAGTDRTALATARAAFSQALLLDPADTLGAGLRLAQTGGDLSGPALSPAYVRALFDGYAPSFDRHLVEGLGYRGPERLREAILAAVRVTGREPFFPRALDLGCGTGLMARGLGGLAGAIEGVDLSPGMLERAGRLGLYAALHEGGLEAFLAGREAGSADLVVACDVLVYVGDLGPVFRHTARVLAGDGLFAATLQSSPDGGDGIGADGRQAHSAGAVRALAGIHGLGVALLEDVSVRRQGGVDAPGLVVVLNRLPG